jgi:hypothetical protein
MLDYLGVEVVFESVLKETAGSYYLSFTCEGQGSQSNENVSKNITMSCL